MASEQSDPSNDEDAHYRIQLRQTGPDFDASSVALAASMSAPGGHRLILGAVAATLLVPLCQTLRAQTAAGALSRPKPKAPAEIAPLSAIPGATAVVRLYQVCRETQITDAKITRSDSPGFLIALSVEGDAVALYEGKTVIRYKLVGHRMVYQPANEEGSMQTGAPALVAVRADQGRVEALTVTPSRLTIVRSLEAMDGYVLTTARFAGERPCVPPP